MSADPHRIGAYRIGYTRIGVVEPLFERWINQNLTVEVTRRHRIVSGSSDLYTQHPNITWTESTIDVVMRLGPPGREDMDIGMLGSVDGIVKTADPLLLGDQIEYMDRRYEVHLPPIEVRGRYGGFLYRKCGIKRVEMEKV